VLQVLNNEADAPQDLRQKALRLAGRVLEFDPDVRGGQGFNIARDILDSGRALKKMQSIIEVQGRKDFKYRPGHLRLDIVAPKDGVVVGIDNLQMARIARLAGAPMDIYAGVDLFKKLGDPVRKGEPLYALYADFPADFRFAQDRIARDIGYRIGTADEIPSAAALF